MYESYYGLTGKPFQLNPDPRFYYASKQHRRAKAYLEYGMHQNEGFIVITGEVGAGKTTIVRGLLDALDEGKVMAAHLVSTQLDAEDTLKLVGAAYGIKTAGVAKAELLMALEAFFVDQTRLRKRCILIVDEAQNLSARAVEELRMLSNFQFGNQALLQTFLVGQPEFREILQSPHMQQLRQRVIASCHIGSLDVEDTRGYIEHRLHCVGASGRPEFEVGAFDAVFKASGGIPRRINAVCDRLLLLGYLGGKDHFVAEDVDDVARELREETQGVARATPAVPADGEIADLTRFELENQVADQMLEQMRALGKDNADGRLRRLERSLLRLEQVNSEMLALMKQLVRSARRADDSGKK